MFGKSRGLKAIEGNASSVLSGFRDSVEAGGSTTISRDAVVMFAGWLHFAITYLLSARQLKPNDVFGATAAAAIAVRAVAPDHNLGNGYLELAMHRVKQALLVPDAYPTAWAFNYFDLASDELSINQAVFAGALLRESAAVMQIPDLRSR